MAVIDGKYEILSQRPLEEGQTFFSATAPDGAALSIVWFDLATPQQEVRFERYRQVLRTLKKQNLAALHDIVSRPGAHYVAWYTPGHQQKTAATAELEHTLRSYGYTPAQADIRVDKSGGSLVYGLAFGETSTVPEPATPPGPRGQPAARPRLSLELLPLWVLRWGLGILLLLVGGGFFYTSFKLGANDSLVTVPDLTALPVNEAAKTLYDLRLGVATEAVASAEAPYTVLALSPVPGSETRPGSAVRLSYALPADQVALATVPQLRGNELSAEVAERLEAAKLRLGEVAYVHSNIAQNVIIAQSHEAGTRANEGSTVHLLVSQGPKPQETFVPDIVGLPLEDALALARLAGVNVAEPTTEPGGQAAPGTVLAQSLPPNTPLAQREVELRLTVAGGAAPPLERPVPSLVGMSRTEAERTAADAGYTLEVETIDNDTDSLNLPEGVVSQSPPPGSAANGDSLSILLNQRPVPVPRPEVAATVRRPRQRELAYTFYVEPAIPEIEARVRAVTVGGKTHDILTSQTVTGGEELSGEWRTREPGPVTFQLFLGTGTEPYQQITLNP